MILAILSRNPWSPQQLMTMIMIKTKQIPAVPRRREAMLSKYTKVALCKKFSLFPQKKGGHWQISLQNQPLDPASFCGSVFAMLNHLYSKLYTQYTQFELHLTWCAELKKKVKKKTTVLMYTIYCGSSRHTAPKADDEWIYQRVASETVYSVVTFMVRSWGESEGDDFVLTDRYYWSVGWLWKFSHKDGMILTTIVWKWQKFVWNWKKIVRKWGKFYENGKNFVKMGKFLWKWDFFFSKN